MLPLTPGVPCARWPPWSRRWCRSARSAPSLPTTSGSARPTSATASRSTSPGCPTPRPSPRSCPRWRPRSRRTRHVRTGPRCRPCRRRRWRGSTAGTTTSPPCWAGATPGASSATTWWTASSRAVRPWGGRSGLWRSALRCACRRRARMRAAPESSGRVGATVATRRPFVPAWSTVVPVVAVVALVLTWGRPLGPLPVTLVALVLAAAVLSAVHHAEVVAYRVGEPFGSLVLAVAVTVIEVALILMLMGTGGPSRRPGTRHRLRRADDHLSTGSSGSPCWSARCGTASPVQRGGHRGCPGDGHLTGHAQPGAAQLHLQPQGSRVLVLPSSPSPPPRPWRCTADVRPHPDGPAPRLLPGLSGRDAGRGAGRVPVLEPGTAVPAWRPLRPRRPRPALTARRTRSHRPGGDATASACSPGADVRRRAGQGGVPRHRGRCAGRRPPAVVRRCRHRAAGAAAGDARGRARRRRNRMQTSLNLGSARRWPASA